MLYPVAIFHVLKKKTNTTHIIPDACETVFARCYSWRYANIIGVAFDAYALRCRTICFRLQFYLSKTFNP